MDENEFIMESCKRVPRGWTGTKLVSISVPIDLISHPSIPIYTHEWTCNIKLHKDKSKPNHLSGFDFSFDGGSNPTTVISVEIHPGHPSVPMNGVVTGTYTKDRVVGASFFVGNNNALQTYVGHAIFREIHRVLHLEPHFQRSTHGEWVGAVPCLCRPTSSPSS